jgi:hypothetical protein
MSRCRIAALLGIAVLAVPLSAQQPSPEELTFFESKIRPVLIQECYGCHSNQAGNVRGGLRLDTKELTLMGGSSGPAVVPGKLDESLLYAAITHDGLEMPPKRMLPQNVINDFRQWIEKGAFDPRVTDVAEIKSAISEQDIREARESFWAYQLPVQNSPPAVADSAWPKTEIDHFILAKLEASDLKPAGDAEAHKVLRRLCFDLVGLPPTPEQLEQFVSGWQHDPDLAIASLVEQLLAKEQFGERWGRHWLDVARYAESTGREVNMTYPHAWRYRDYVIDAFNQDKPFDQFVREQIAGDLLPAKSDQVWANNLVATTFLAIGPKNVNEQNRVQFAADLLDEQIDATTRVFLGMSVACARCHDHKFDAIPQSDYYALAGIFQNMTTYYGNPPSEYGAFSGVQARRSSSLLLLPVDDPNPYDKRYSQQELTDLRSQLTGTLREAAESRRSSGPNGGNSQNAIFNRLRTANQLAELSAKLAVVDEQGNPRSYCMGVQERAAPQNARLLVRGEIDQQAQVVPRGFPQVLCAEPASIEPSSSGRLELANWIGSEDNPLTARVMVNRVWQHLIGQGIVPSTENFGVTGQLPSHPELLDHLAVRFVQSGWSVKEVIRDIATSRVYRMKSTFDERSHQYDPDNALLWRANPRRLDAEVIRDAMLHISGQIDLERPRGSEVAKAGYTRVREGVLGDPREIARKVAEAAAEQARQAMQERFLAGRGGPARPGLAPRFGGRFPGLAPASRADSTANSPGRGQAMEAMMQQVARKVSGALDMEEARFRSVYLPIVRDQEPRSLEVFDFADANTVTGTRESSNTANQALYMMNNRFVIEQSQGLARRVANHSTRPDLQLEYAFLLAYGRPPVAAERSATASFIKAFAGEAGGRSSSDQTLAAICQSLFAAAEFRYID